MMDRCEWCWSEARRRALWDSPAEDVHTLYYKVMREQDAKGVAASCPIARESAEALNRGPVSTS